MNGIVWFKDRKARIRCLAYVLMACMSLLSSCKRADSVQGIAERPTIVFTIATQEESQTVNLLRSDSYRRGLEETYGISVELVEIRNMKDMKDMKDHAEITFEGAMITDYVNWMIPFSDDSKILQLTGRYPMAEPQFGRTGGKQMAFVFNEGRALSRTPRLVVNRDLLERAGVSPISYDPQSVLDLLSGLSEQTAIPLAVYGCPAESGFAVLLGLFGLAPLGGYEYYLSDNSMHMDKIEANALEYLAYIRQLYDKGYIPKNFLSLNEYSCRILFLQGKSAMTIATDDASAMELVNSAANSGMHATIEALPVAAGLLDTGVFNRTIGMIAKNSSHADLILQVFLQLQRDVAMLPPPHTPIDVSTALFLGNPSEVVEDRVTNTFLDYRKLFEKYLMDKEIIKPYYSQMAVGNLELSAFETMKAEWINDFDINVDSADNNLSGRGILQIMYGWATRHN